QDFFRDQLALLGVWAVANDEVRFGTGDARQYHQLRLTCSVYVYRAGFVAIPTFFHTFHHSLGILLDLGGRLGGLFANLVSIVRRLLLRASQHQQSAQQQVSRQFQQPRISIARHVSALPSKFRARRGFKGLLGLAPWLGLGRLRKHLESAQRARTKII